MTTPSTARKAGPLLGNGSTTAFPFTFKVFAAADVAVTIANSSGVETPLVLNTDYSVALNGNQDTSPGGTITYPISGAALPSGSKLSIVGDIDYDQPLDLPSGGNFSPLALENQLDRATMQIQQLAEGLSRAAKLPVTNSEDPATLVADIVRLADSADNIDTLVANLADITTVADDLNEPVSEINTVAGAITNVNNVGNNITNVNTVAGISANVTTVAAIDDDVTAVAGVAANVTTVAGVSAAVTAVAAIDDDVTIAAANVADITNFADVYQGPKTSDPTLRNDGSALQVGDLYFNTVEQALRTYGGTQWVSGTAGTVAVQNFSGNASTTAFTLATAPAGENNTQVYIGGVYQQKDQYSVSGTTLTFSTAPPSGTNNVEVVTISTLAIGETDASLVTFLQAGTGAVERTAQAKLREFVSVKDFGAVGDGVADDTAAIQEALVSGAKRVYAPAGTYLTTGTLSIPSGVELFGDGKGRTIINCTTSSTTAVKRIIRSAAINFDGVCPADNYTTNFDSTGDYFVSGPSTFAAASTIKSGASSFTASASVSIAPNTWLYVSEGIPAWHPAKSEFVQVASTSGSTVNLKTKLRNLYANTTTSLGAFIRSYALTTSPGGGGTGYPDMSTWADAGYRVVVPVVNSSVHGLTILCNQSGLVSKIAWIAHLAVQCEIDVEVIDGTFWVVDCQDLKIKVCGGAPSMGSSYVGNGTNGVVCDIDISNQVAIEEGAQNISGVVKALGYSTIKQFVANVNVDFFASADATPAVEVSTVRDVVIKPHLKARGTTLNVITPSLSTIATNLPQAFLSGEVPLYYGCGLTTLGGESISTDNPTLSIRTANGGQVRCIDTVVPVGQASRYKGTQVLNGRKQIQSVTTAPLFSDLESGERFISTTLGEIAVTGVWSSTISQQFNFGTGTLNTLIVDNLDVNNVQVNDVIVFRVSDSAAAPVNWTWQVAEVTAVRPASNALTYSPANSAGRTAITAAGEDQIFVFRVSKRFAQPALVLPRSGADAQYGGFIGGIGVTYGAPIQLGTYQLWVDSSGRLRIKNGVPTSDTDGTVVGTQT
jgi:hypothetical protein